MRRNIRFNIDMCLTALGIGIIFTAIILSSSLTVQVQLPIALVGVLLMEAGIWGLSGKIFPSERRYIDLRAEGDYIIKLIRELNSASIARDRAGKDDGRFQATLDEMHNSVDRMAELASRDTGSSSPAN